MSKLFHYFFGVFHSGPVNRVIHLIGFCLLVYALVTGSVLLLWIAPAIMELGHLYNSLTIKNYRQGHSLLAILLSQVIAYLFLVGLLLSVFSLWRIW